MSSNPRADFLVGYDAFPFGGPETKMPGTPEWRGWWTRAREGVHSAPKSERVYSVRENQRPFHAPYKPRLSGSDAAVNTVLRWL